MLAGRSATLTWTWKRFMVQDSVATEQEDTGEHGLPPQQFSVR